MDAKSIYERFARLFEYPGEDYRANAEKCPTTLRREHSEAAASLEEFCAPIRSLNTDDLRELFTRTFDLNPMCALEIGWQLYGEDYQRGEFLVKMGEQLREHSLRESGELPDHLTHALVLLAHLEPDEAAEFAGGFLLPALDKMRANWRENRNAFAALLDFGICDVLGLYLVLPVHADLVHKPNGRYQLYRAPDRSGMGETFYFELPPELGSAVPSAAATREQDESTHAFCGSNPGSFGARNGSLSHDRSTIFPQEPVAGDLGCRYTRASCRRRCPAQLKPILSWRAGSRRRPPSLGERSQLPLRQLGIVALTASQMYLDARLRNRNRDSGEGSTAAIGSHLQNSCEKEHGNE